MAELTIDPRAVFGVKFGGAAALDAGYCGDRHGTYRCWRAAEHDGRHACIRANGEVVAVWGPDVHAHLRPIIIDAPTHHGYSQRMAAADHVHTPDGVCIKRRSGRRCPRPRVVVA